VGMGTVAYDIRLLHFQGICADWDKSHMGYKLWKFHMFLQYCAIYSHRMME
jgi:hypothetical protein